MDKGYTKQEKKSLKQGQSVQYSYKVGGKVSRGSGKVVYVDLEGEGSLGVFGITPEDRQPKLRLIPHYLTAGVLISRTRLNKKFGELFKEYIRGYNIRKRGVSQSSVKVLESLKEDVLRQLNYSRHPQYKHYGVLEHIKYSVSYNKGEEYISIVFKNKNNNEVREILSEELITERLSQLDYEDSKVRCIFSTLGFRTYFDEYINEKIKGKAKVKSVAKLVEYGEDYEAELVYNIQPLKELDNKGVVEILVQILMI